MDAKYFLTIPLASHPHFSLSDGLDIALEDYENCKSDFYPVTSYLLRTFDAEIYCSPNNHVFFCKVPRFFFWAIIERNETDLNFGIRVKPEGGTIDFKRYNIGNGEVKRFIFKRCYDADQLFRDATNKLSDRNIDNMIERMVRKDNIDHLKNSEAGELLYDRVEYQSQIMD